MSGILDAFKLDGKVALVTGSERGLGRGMAVALAQAGADIVGVTHTPDAPETAAAIEATGRKYVHVQANLLSIEPIEGVVAKAVEAFGHVDILVNNAGIIMRNDSVDFTEEDWDAVMDVNLKSTFFLCQAYAKNLLGKGAQGRIVNIASVLSFQGGIRVPSYTASKHGIVGITRLLANEWAAKGINVNAIAPGYVVSNNTEALRADPDRSASILGRIPAGRWGKPEDIGDATVFLLAPASNYMHGAVVPVDGGWLAR